MVLVIHRFVVDLEGYAKGNPDAFFEYKIDRNNIDSSYLDGVSITRGSPHQHVWTFVTSSATIISRDGKHNCPCSPGSTQQVPSFIGNNYYCESGSAKSADPL